MEYRINGDIPLSGGSGLGSRARARFIGDIACSILFAEENWKSRRVCLCYKLEKSQNSTTHPPNQTMKIHTLTSGVVAAAIASFAAMAQAQSDITWQSPVTISSASDVNNSGTLLGTWAPYNGNASSGLTVNGVTFQAFPDLPGASDTFDNGGGNGTFATLTTGDVNYDNLLNAGAFGNNSTPYSISWNGMTVGNTYLIQFWVNDGRNDTVNQRTETLTGGANTSAALAYGSGSSGPGQFIIGTFVANNASETLTLTPGAAFPSAQFDLLQVRDITPVPEPSVAALFVAGFGILLRARRKK
jgi:hypothetical protein